MEVPEPRGRRALPGARGTCRAAGEWEAGAAYCSYCPVCLGFDRSEEVEAVVAGRYCPGYCSSCGAADSVNDSAFLWVNLEPPGGGGDSYGSCVTVVRESRTGKVLWPPGVHLHHWVEEGAGVVGSPYSHYQVHLAVNLSASHQVVLVAAVTAEDY